MKVPLSWLKEYLDISISPVEIAKTLTMIGLEVEAVHTQSLSCQKVIVGRVLSVQKHPNADKLVLAKVTDGLAEYDLVCGAPNCREGIKTAFAMVGASLSDEEGKEFKVKKSKIRGIESSGMLCSGKELGLSDDHDGILEFAEQISVGADVAELYADYIFDVALTPNLAHCASIFGIARELSAALEIPLRKPAFALVEDSSSIDKLVKVEVANSTDCPRYTARLVADVLIQPSPEWLRKKIEAAGMRSINNVVDAANFVLLELGHPLHTFDYDKIQGGKIRVRSAKQGEKFVTLDGKERSLQGEDLLICDAEKPVALAGIMGGINSEVTADTRRVLIESAYFNPSCIRRTSKRLGLSTDSSKRFERGCDPNGLHFALDRLAALIQTLSKEQDSSLGKVAKGVVEHKAREFLPNVIFCRKSRANGLLGTRLSAGEIESVFHRLGFSCEWDGQDLFTVTVPTYRVDILKEIDLIEEVARFYGYDNIPRISGKAGISTLPHAPIFLFEREVRSRLMAEGLQEFLTCDLIGPTLLHIVKDDSFEEESAVKVLNPTSIEQSVLRTSLLPGLLGVVKYNIDHQNHNLFGFEVGRIHFKEVDQYKEQSVAGIVLSGKTSPHHWDRKPEDVDFYDLKGIVENTLKELRIPDVRFVPNKRSTFHPGRQASIFSGSLEIGSLGEVHPAIQKRLDVDQRIFFAELNLHDMFRVKLSEEKMKPLPIFPSSERDWTITLKAETPIDDVLTKICCIHSNLLENVSLLDIYRSEKLGLDKMNATFHFVYRDKQKTIEQEAVDNEHKRIVEDVLHLLKNAVHTDF